MGAEMLVNSFPILRHISERFLEDYPRQAHEVGKES